MQRNNGSRFGQVLLLVGLLSAGTLVAFVVLATQLEDPSPAFTSLVAFITPTIAAVLAIARVGVLEGRADANQEAAAQANTKAEVAVAKAESAEVAATVAMSQTSPEGGTPAVRLGRPLSARQPKEWGG